MDESTWHWGIENHINAKTNFGLWCQHFNTGIHAAELVINKQFGLLLRLGWAWLGIESIPMVPTNPLLEAAWKRYKTRINENNDFTSNQPHLQSYIGWNDLKKLEDLVVVVTLLSDSSVMNRERPRRTRRTSSWTCLPTVLFEGSRSSIWRKLARSLLCVAKCSMWPSVETQNLSELFIRV